MTSIGSILFGIIMFSFRATITDTEFYFFSFKYVVSLKILVLPPRMPNTKIPYSTVKFFQVFFFRIKLYNSTQEIYRIRYTLMILSFT